MSLLAVCVCVCARVRARAMHIERTVVTPWCHNCQRVVSHGPYVVLVRSPPG